MRTLFLITARLKSTRLPRKLLLDLGGKPAIVQMVERLKYAQRISDIVICTSTHPDDDALCDVARQQGILWFRGSEEDVLDRLHQAARHLAADYVVNTTADCPLVDPEHVDKTVDEYRQTGADLLTAYRLPHGAYAWGIKVQALGRACDIKAETDTEVWRDYFEKTGRFDVRELEIAPALQRPELRITLDYPEDLAVLRRIFEALDVSGRLITLRDIIAWLDAHPEVVAMNRHCAALYHQHRRGAAPMRLKGTMETAQKRSS